jgi:hypothetical protein
MYGKILFAVGLGAGYLLGTSRGRKDFEMLKRRVSEAWLDPRVQKVAKQATDVVEKNVPMGENFTEAVEAATKSARSTVGTSGSGSASSGSGGSGSGSSGSGSSGSGSSGSGRSTSGSTASGTA